MKVYEQSGYRYKSTPTIMLKERFAVICKGDFPFPFQTSDQIGELEVKSRMQAIDFFARSAGNPCGSPTH
jgi:hypothetical protein